MGDIKLVLCDIDGTLLTSQKDISSKTKAAISKLKEHDILFGIATGRTPYAVRKLIKDWGIDKDVDLIMGFNGASFLEMKTGETQSCCLLDGQYIQEILDDFKNFKTNAGIYDKETFHCLKEDEKVIELARHNQLELIIDDFQRFSTCKIEKMLFISEPKVIDKMSDYYKNDIHTSHYRAVRSTPILLEFLNPQLSKSKGIENICHYYGISFDNILAFGDELNDYEMIRDCIGVAMGNGNEEVKKVAKYVTKGNDEDGIAVFLNNYIFKK